VGVNVGVAVKDGVTVNVTVGGIVAVAVACGAAAPQAVSKRTNKINENDLGFIFPSVTIKGFTFQLR
jgi:hypothetical protein